MNRFMSLIVSIVLPLCMNAQDLTEGLLVNDLALRPMQDILKPDYLQTIVDPSFGTTIRRISNADPGGVIVPMYSTVQAWNTDETFMILYNQSTGKHELLDGMTYQFLRVLDDVDPADLEQIFWDFADADIFYFLDAQTYDFIKYSVGTQTKELIANLASVSNCTDGIEMGYDIQMMSWDSDILTFRCGNEHTYSYRISTGQLTAIAIDEVDFVAPGVAPSGERYYHSAKVYDTNGAASLNLNINSTEHSCIGKLANGNDAYYAIAFAEGPDGSCIGDIIAHDLATGECIPVISQSQGYDYPQSGTHISALAHKNTQGGWIAASMMGYDKDGQSLLDQELVIARVADGNIQVCRIGHHRSDEDDVDYWGEPHAVISPTGTRVLYASDWSGAEDGQSIDSYVVELPAHTATVAVDEVPLNTVGYTVHPNPAQAYTTIELEAEATKGTLLTVYDISGKQVFTDQVSGSSYRLDTSEWIIGLYTFQVVTPHGLQVVGRVVKH